MKTNTIFVITSFLMSFLIIGCASKYKSLSPELGVAVTLQNKGLAATTYLHSDQNCSPLKGGDWLGVIGEKKISYMSEYQKTVYVTPGQKVTLYMEWWDMGFVNGHCPRSATFTPTNGYEYIAEYSWPNSNECKLAISTRKVGSGANFYPLSKKKVAYSNQHCSHK